MITGSIPAPPAKTGGASVSSDLRLRTVEMRCGDKLIPERRKNTRVMIDHPEQSRLIQLTNSG